MKIMYYSEDGKAFENKKECLDYEEKQAAKETERISEILKINTTLTELNLFSNDSF